MSQRLKLEVKALNAIGGQDLVILVSDALTPAKLAEEWLGDGARGLLARAAAAERFKGKALAGLTLLAPDDAGYERLIVIGIGPQAERGKLDFAKLGGVIAGRLGHGRAAGHHRGSARFGDRRRRDRRDRTSASGCAPTPSTATRPRRRKRTRRSR